MEPSDDKERSVRYEWDDHKDASNLKKHGISFDLAKTVFFDPFCFTIPDESSKEEERLWTVGRLRTLTLAVVVHTSVDESGELVVRIISARKATPQERRLYEEAQ